MILSECEHMLQPMLLEFKPLAFKQLDYCERDQKPFLLACQDTRNMWIANSEVIYIYICNFIAGRRETKLSFVREITGKRQWANKFMFGMTIICLPVWNNWYQLDIICPNSGWNVYIITRRTEHRIMSYIHSFRRNCLSCQHLNKYTGVALD